VQGKGQTEAPTKSLGCEFCSSGATDVQRYLAAENCQPADPETGDDAVATGSRRDGRRSTGYAPVSRAWKKSAKPEGRCCLLVSGWWASRVLLPRCRELHLVLGLGGWLALASVAGPL